MAEKISISVQRTLQVVAIQCWLAAFALAIGDTLDGPGQELRPWLLFTLACAVTTSVLWWQSVALPNLARRIAETLTAANDLRRLH